MVELLTLQGKCSPLKSKSAHSSRLELVTSMAEVALSEREDLGELDREDENRIWEDLVLIVVVKGAIAYEILPSS